MIADLSTVRARARSTRRGRAALVLTLALVPALTTDTLILAALMVATPVMPIPVAGAIPAGTRVPLPRPRPFDAPRIEPAPKPATAPGPPAETASVCQRALMAVAVATPLAPIAGPGDCGADDVVQIEAILLPNGRRATLQPMATTRCAMATALSAWVREALVPAAAPLRSPIAGLRIESSFDCRGRNRVAGARLSEHGRANAVDVAAIVLGDGRRVALTDPAVDKGFRQAAKDTACARFTTVLGPQSDGYHETHIHLDILERRGGYRLCQWAVLEPGEGEPPPAASPASSPASAGPPPSPAPARTPAAPGLEKPAAPR